MSSTRFSSQSYFAQMPRLVVYEMGVHFFDMMRYLFCEPLRLAATIGHASSEVAGGDNAVVLVSYENPTVIMDISWASIPTYPKRDSVSWAVMTIEGEGGTMHLSHDGRLRDVTDNTEEVFQFGPGSIDAGFEGMQRRFIECVAGSLECEMSGREYAKSMELVFGSYASAETQQVYRVSEDRHSLAWLDCTFPGESDKVGSSRAAHPDRWLRA